MKAGTPFRVLIALAIVSLGLLAQTAFAFPFTDAFNYPLGNLSSNVNSEGDLWGACDYTNVPDVMVTNITLTYPGLSCPGTNSVFFTGTNVNGAIQEGISERIAVAPLVETITTNTNTMVVTTNYSDYALTNGTIYASFVFVMTNMGTSGLNGAAGTFFAGFNNQIGPQTTEPSTFALEVCVREDQLLGPPFYQMGLGMNGQTTARVYTTNDLVGWAGPSYTNTVSTNFIVVSYTTNYSIPTNYLLMWINPSSNYFGAASPPPNADVTNATYPAPAFAAGLQSFVLRQGNSFVPSILLADLRIGTNWSDVTPPVNTNSAPSAVPLYVMLSGTNVVLSWTTNSSGFRLEGMPVANGASNAWTNVTASTNVVGTNYSVTDTISGANYYRLAYP